MRHLYLPALAVCLVLGSALAQGMPWSTYYGGAGDEGAAWRGMQRLPNGQVVVVGSTTSTNLVVPAAIHPTYGGMTDGFIACFDPRLTGSAQCVWATYLGGSGYDEVKGVALAANGDILVCGYTASADFPTTAGSFSTVLNGLSDGFVARIHVQANTPQLVWSTYFGGPGNNESAAAVAVQSTGDVVVAGSTDGQFPIVGPALQPTFGGAIDVVVAVLNGAGSSLLASTYFGNVGTDMPNCLLLDADRPVVGGATDAGVPTTPGALQPGYIGVSTFYDGFVSRFDAGLGTLQFSTHLAGGATDFLQAIAMSPGGRYAVAGWTMAGNPMFPTTTGVPYAGGSFDAFVALLDPNQSGPQQLAWSTFFGGAQSEGIWDLAVDGSGLISAVGGSDSTNLPVTPCALRRTYAGGASDAWVARIHQQSRTSHEVLYCSYLGGGSRDRALGVALDALGGAIVAGSTDSTNWPVTPGAFQPTYGGGSGTPGAYGDVFVANLTLLPASVARISGAPACAEPVKIGVGCVPPPGGTLSFYASEAPSNAIGFLIVGWQGAGPVPFPSTNACLLFDPYQPYWLAPGSGSTGLAWQQVVVPPQAPAPFGVVAQWAFLDFSNPTSWVSASAGLGL